MSLPGSLYLKAYIFFSNMLVHKAIFYPQRTCVALCKGKCLLKFSNQPFLSGKVGFSRICVCAPFALKVCKGFWLFLNYTSRKVQRFPVCFFLFFPVCFFPLSADLFFRTTNFYLHQLAANAPMRPVPTPYLKISFFS